MKTGGNAEQDFQWEENSSVHAVHVGSLTYWESWVRTLLLVVILVIISFGYLRKFVNAFILHAWTLGKLPPIPKINYFPILLWTKLKALSRCSRCRINKTDFITKSLILFAGYHYIVSQLLIVMVANSFLTKRIWKMCFSRVKQMKKDRVHKNPNYRFMPCIPRIQSIIWIDR